MDEMIKLMVQFQDIIDFDTTVYILVQEEFYNQLIVKLTDPKISFTHEFRQNILMSLMSESIRLQLYNLSYNVLGLFFTEIS